VDLPSGKADMRTKKTKRKWVDRDEFYIARCRAGLTTVKAAEMLDVTERTIRNWENGTSDIPYSAFRLMRLAGGYVFAGKGWEGWTFSHGKLWTPENRSFEPHELRYVANYLSMARIWIKTRTTNPKPEGDQSQVPPASGFPPALMPLETTVRERASAATAAAGVSPFQGMPKVVCDAAGLQIKPIIGENGEKAPRIWTIDASLKTAANDDMMQEVN
jgi:transcriptional regulator with XRE-family HTH domain